MIFIKSLWSSINRKSTACAYASITFCAVLIAYYLYLLPEYARWFATDEYWMFAKFKQGGLSALLERLMHWSPRPFSESLMYLYSIAVEYTHSQLKIPFLLTCWVGLIAAIAYSVFHYGQGNRLYKIVLAMSLFCLFLEVGSMGHEIFYWPAAAAAYLPTLSALCIILFYTCSKKFPFLDVSVVVFLVLAATSSETGAIFVAVFSVLLFIWNAFFFPVQLPLRQYVYLGIPFFISVAVLATMLMFRLGGQEAVLNADNLHHLNLWNGCKTLAWEWIDPTEQIQKWSILEKSPLPIISLVFFVILGVAGKCMYFMGVRGCWRLSNPDNISSKGWIVFALSLMVTCYAFILLAYFQFGGTVGICCHRYNEIRQCFYVLVITVLAIGYRGKCVFDNKINLSIAIIFLIVALAANVAVNHGFDV